MERKTKRTAISLISAALLLLAASTALSGQGDGGLWDRYKKSFISDDGRTVDYHQGQTSHSEGQGYAMLFAVANDDRAVFDRVWRWTRNNIAVRPDSLFAWQWGRRINTEWAVIDYNNATDGDTLIAYALIKGADKWKEPSYLEDAKKIVAGIRSHLAIDWRGRTLLLPSYYGFENNGAFEINVSYLIFPAFKAFAGIDDKGFWTKVYEDGLEITLQSCYSSLCLPADWMVLGAQGPEVSRGRSVYFGAESIRTFLNLVSTGARLPKGAAGLLDFYAHNGYMPLYVDLEHDSISTRAAPAGYYAIYSAVARSLGEDVLAARLKKEATEKLKAEKNDYYSFSLFLLYYALAGQV